MNPSLRKSQLPSHIRRGNLTDLRLSVRSAVPGRALKLSAAPPTIIVIADPGPDFKIFEHDCLLTLHMPRAKIISRYIGILKFEAKVRRCGLIPGNALEKPVALYDVSDDRSKPFG